MKEALAVCPVSRQTPWSSPPDPSNEGPVHEAAPQSFPIPTRMGPLTDVFVCKLVSQTDSLRLMLYGLAIYDRLLELLNDSLMNCVTLGVC